MKKIISVALILIMAFTLMSCSEVKNQPQATLQTASSSEAQAASTDAVSTAAAPSESPSASSAQAPSQAAIAYQNTDYGFTFSLPESWQNYTILEDQWEGLAADETSGEQAVQTGPQISIRHPKWTEDTPRQDIPIMVFTLAQWDDLQQDKFHIGAAPVGPTELGRNSKYVFALPARYNFAFPEGYEEVDQLLQTNPLHPDENISK